MKLIKIPQSKTLQKTAMPARLGEIDGIVHPMPVILSDEAKNDYPSFNRHKVQSLVEQDPFLNFVYSEIGEGETSLRQIFNLFILEDNDYTVQYNKSNWYREAQGRYDEVPEKHKGGDCFTQAGRYVLDEGIRGNKGFVLVHAIIRPLMGPLAGVDYGHAWVEDGDTIIDTARNNEKMEKQSYYMLAGLINFPTQEDFENRNYKPTVKEDRIHRYTFEEVRQMAVERGDYGPWESSLDEYVVDRDDDGDEDYE
jgi:hypothetical protein